LFIQQIADTVIRKSTVITFFLKRQWFKASAKITSNFKSAHLLPNTVLISRDGKETEPSKNEPNRNPGFPTTEPKPESKNVQEPKANPVSNRTELGPKCRGSYLVLSLTEIVRTFIDEKRELNQMN